MKKIAIGAATSLMAILILIVGIGSSWFTNWNVKTWFGKGVEDIGMPSQSFENDGDGIKVSENQNNGVYFTSATIERANFALYGIPNNADSAKLLTATAYPADAVVTFDWTVEWIVSTIDTTDHTTTEVVTDYVTVTPLKDGSNQATITCLKPFPYRIAIRARVREADLDAVCHVDYEKKVERAVLTFSPSTGSPSVIEFDVLRKTVNGKLTMPLTQSFSVSGEWVYSRSTVSPAWLPATGDIRFLLKCNRTVFDEMKADGINLEGFIPYESYPYDTTRRLSDLIIHMGEDNAPDGKKLADYPELLKSVATWLSTHPDKSFFSIQMFSSTSAEGYFAGGEYPVFLTPESFTQVSNVEMLESAVTF